MTRTILELVPLVVALMHADNVLVRDPVSGERLDDFERQWNVKLPDDMRAFYQMMDGTSKESAITADLFCIWPISEVKPIPDWLPEPHYAEYRQVDRAIQTLCFSDYMIDSGVFAVRAFDGNAVISVSTGHRIVASNFTDFISRLLFDRYSLL